MRIPAILIALTATPLLAQTATHHAATTRSETHHAAYAGGCVHVPELSPKIPALPPDSPCPRALYTITHHPTVTLDYGSPLLSPELRTMLDQKPETFSLIYVDTHVGTGPLAQAHKWYTVHYTGYLADGTKFDSSVDRGEPISFPYGAHRVIEGWDTGFEGMRIGGKRRLYVPYELGYGETAHGPIPAKSELIFDVELISQSDTQPAQARPAQPRPHTNETRPEPNGATAMPKPSASPTTPAGAAEPAKPATSPEPK